MIKTIMVEKKVFDTDILKSGQRIHFGWKYIDGTIYDEGDGEILEVNETAIYLRYLGHYGETYRCLTPNLTGAVLKLIDGGSSDED